MKLHLVVKAILLVALLSPTAALAEDKKTVIYFTRHQNDTNRLVSPSVGHFEDVCHGPTRPCCEQVLDVLGVERSARFADWFAQHHLTETLNLVVATFKPRTSATVQRIATDAALPIVVIPAGMAECGDTPDPTVFDATVGMQPMYDYLSTLPQGTTALVAAHSTTIYAIFDRFGIDVLADHTFYPLELPAGATTCDPHSVAKSGPVNSRGCKLLGFNNLWRMEIDKHGHATVTDHWILGLDMNATSHDNEGLGGGHDDDD